MIERIILIENVDPVVFFGINNSNIQLLKTLFPKLRIVARGNVIKVIGEEEELMAFGAKIHELEKFSNEMNVLKEEDILDIVKGKAPSVVNVDNLIIHGLNGKPILARTFNQKKLVEVFDFNDMVFAIGPAGSGEDLYGYCPGCTRIENKAGTQDHTQPPGSRSRRKTGVSSGRHEGEN